MFEISFVNFLQVSLLTLSLFGISLLSAYQRFRYISQLLLLVSVASIFNLLEELNITRQIHLVTPVFIMGFGPAIYIAIKSLLVDRINAKIYWHYLPMILALPFTYYTEVIIALGTVWRVAYAYLTVKRLYQFHLETLQERSDAAELSMRWLEWGLVIITLVSICNLIRLNLQPIISHQINMIGQGISTAVSVLFIAVLIRQLIKQKNALLSLSEGEQNVQSVSSSSELGLIDEQRQLDDSEYYKSIFSQLSNDVVEKQWYKIPRLTLKKLSELTGLQTRDISRAINLGAQQNFNDYINQLRLEFVVNEFKRNKDKSILSLATKAGFNSKSNFNLVFKRHYSMTPQQYRSTKF